MSNIIDFPIGIQYLYALFWSVITTNGIADGNIYPGNYYEVLLLVGTVIILFIFFGYFLNMVFYVINFMN